MSALAETENYYCDLCCVSYPNAQAVKEHTWSLMHHIKYEHKQGKGISHQCILCKKSYKNLAEYGKHLNEITHKNNVEDDKRTTTGSPDSTISSAKDPSQNRSSRWDNDRTHEKYDDRRDKRKQPSKERGRSVDFHQRWNRPDFQNNPNYGSGQEGPYWQDDMNYGYHGWHDFNRGGPYRGPPPPPNPHMNYFGPNFHQPPRWRGRGGYMRGGSNYQQGRDNYSSDYGSHGGPYHEDDCGNADSQSNTDTNSAKGVNLRVSRWESPSNTPDNVKFDHPVTDAESTTESETNRDSLSNKASKLIDDILSGKPIPKPSKDKDVLKKTMEKPETTSSSDILKKAEDLCSEMKKKRAHMEERKKERELLKQRTERDKWNKEAEKLDISSQSHVSGILDDSRLSSLSTSIAKDRSSILRSEREAVSAPPHSSVFDAPLEMNSSGTSTSTISALSSSSARHKMSTIPALTKLKSLNKTENIVKLINSPRSRKDKIEVAKFLQTHKRKQSRPKLAHPERGGDDLDVDSLPEDIKLQINQLIDEVMTDLDVTGATADLSQSSNIINIVPDDEEETPNISAQTLAADLYDKALASLDAQQTSTPNARRNVSQACQEMSDVSAHHSVLFGETQPASVRLLNPTPDYAGSVLDEFSKRLDAEISTIASLHSTSSVVEDSSFVSHDTPTSPQTRVGRGRANLDDVIPNSGASHGSSHQAALGTGLIHVVPDSDTDEDPVKQEQAEFSTFPVSIDIHNEPDSLNNNGPKRRRVQKQVPEPICSSPSPEKVTQVRKKQKIDIHEVIELDSDDDTVAEHDCSMDAIYTISLQEEEIRGKISTADESIAKLENLIRKTQEQLKRRVETKETLEQEEKQLRKKRMKLLKGAIQKNSSATFSASSGSIKIEPEAADGSSESAATRVPPESTPASKLEKSTRQIEEPDSTVGALQTAGAEDPQSSGLQYLGTLDPALLNQISDSYVIMEESQFKKCLSDSAMSQDSEEDVTPVAEADTAPSPSTNVFKKPLPVTDKNTLSVKAEGSRTRAKASSMSNLNTINETEEAIDRKSPRGKGGQGKKSKGHLSDPESTTKTKKKKKKKETKITPQPIASDSSCSVQETKKSKHTKYQKYKPEVQQLIKDYLHAPSSSDVSLSGLELDTSQQSTGSKKKAKKSKKERDQSRKQSDSQSGSTSQTPVASEADVVVKEKLVISPGKTVQYKTTHAGAVRTLVVYKQHLISGGTDHSLYRLKAQNQKGAEAEGLNDILKLRGQSGEMLSACIDDSDPNNPVLYSGSGANTLLVYDIKTGKQLKTHRYADSVCALSKNKTNMHIGLGNGSVLTLDLKTGNNIDAYKHCDGPITCLASGKEGPRPIVCVVGQDCGIAVRDSRNSLLLRSLEGHTKPPTSLAVHFNNVFSGGPDGMVQIHNLNTGEMERTIRTGEPVTCLCVDKTGQLYIASSSGLIRVFSAQDYRQDLIYYAGTGITTMAISSSLWLHIGTKNGTVEAIRCGNQHFECKYGSCRLVCGRKEDLQKHCLMDHVSPGCKVADIICLWGDCGVPLSMKDNKNEKETMKHIAAHLEDVEPK